MGRIKRIMVSVILLATVLTAGCSNNTFDKKLDAIVSPYQFNLTAWEAGEITGDLSDTIMSRNPAPADPQTVQEYFSIGDKINELDGLIDAVKAGDSVVSLSNLEAQKTDLVANQEKLRLTVEQTLEYQIDSVLKDAGINNPFRNFLRIGFPPVNFKLQHLPYLLVISNRDKIDRLRNVNLKQDITEEEMDKIESQADQLNVSSLVVPIGGMATFPSLVQLDAGLRFTLDAAGEEWVHLYLTFRPVGFLYALDLSNIRKDYNAAALDETMASMIGNEIGKLVMKKFYSAPSSANTVAAQQPAPGFDFNSQMRTIRKTVDDYLTKGQVDTAEKYMEQQRQALASEGYYIRKLNQAYFAFYGTYTEGPTSIDPLGTQMNQLRSACTSLKQFIDIASGLTSRQGLKDELVKLGVKPFEG